MSQCSVCGRQGKAFLITAASCDVLPLQIVECVTKSLCIEETPLPMCRNYYANPGKNAGSLTHTYTYTFPCSYILTYSLLG